MTTTTIRIDDRMKKRLAGAAQRAGKSAHALIVEAIAQTVERSEQDDELNRLAEARWEQVLASGKTVAWSDARDYLRARARGKSARRPATRKPKR